MPNNINRLANIINRESQEYELNFLVIEIDGVKWSKTRIDTAEQIEQYIANAMAELNIQGKVVYQEDNAIEFAWYAKDDSGKEINLYMI